MIKPGTYVGTILSHAVSETKAGDPQAAVTFSFEADGKSHTMTWFGSFKEGKAQEITLRALLTCGLKGNNPAGLLEIGKQVSLVIDEEKDQNGKLRTKIKWVNPLGGVKNVMPPDLAMNKLEALAGAVAMARQENNIPDDDIPF